MGTVVQRSAAPGDREPKETGAARLARLAGMGQAAISGQLKLENLPDPVDEETARKFSGPCWDDADWESIAKGNGSCTKHIFVTTVKLRNYAPSMRTWLEYWRIDELTSRMEELEVMSADDLCDIDPVTMGAFTSSLKAVQKCHWKKAMAHAEYLKAFPVGYMPWRPEALMMWLESWRLQRLRPALYDLGVDVKEDLLDLERHHFSSLGMRHLEEKRFNEAVENLMSLIKSFNFLSQRKSCIPTFETWMKSLRLTHCREKFERFGAVDLVDLDDLDPAMFRELKLTKLQEKHFKIGMLQIKAAKREAMADGVADMESFQGTLESWRLTRLLPKCEELGAYMQQDLLDLEPDEYHLLEMRPLEEKRFVQMIAALEDEFDKPPPGEELTEENMTRRQWRKAQSQKYGFGMATTTGAKKAAKDIKIKFSQSAPARR